MDKKRKLIDISYHDGNEGRRKKYSDEEEVLSDAEGTKIIREF